MLRNWLMKTIIVESGATKSDWRVIDSNGNQVARKILDGMNVSSGKMESIRKILVAGLKYTGASDGDSFYMYTAGVVTEAIYEELRSVALSIAKFADIDIQNDLMGAARSVLGHSKGIVAIMGTGSNTCFFDGIEVSQKVMSGGFILGDDGSGAALGRLFLRDFIKNLIPKDVAEDFASKFDASYTGIVQNVYRSPAPAGYLGSLAPFILSHYDNPYIKTMVDANFQAFIDISLKQYDTDTYPVGIVGGFGYANRGIFEPMCEKSGIKVAGFIAEPIDGLIEYHRK